jgi:uncharacterized protein
MLRNGLMFVTLASETSPPIKYHLAEFAYCTSVRLQCLLLREENVRVKSPNTQDIGRDFLSMSLSAPAAGLRLALISDTHGFIDPRIVQVVEACNAVVHAGDIGNHGVLTLLRSRCSRVLAIRGNNDTPKKWSATTPSLLLRVPRALQVSLPGGMLVVVHGDRVSPAATRHAHLRRLYPHARAVLYGHTHRMRLDRRAIPWVLNAGAAGRARTFGGPSCIILDVTARAWRARKLRFAKNA